MAKQLSVRSHVTLYVRQHIDIARVRHVETETSCDALVDKMTNAFLVANEGLQEIISKSIARFPERKQAAIANGWKDKIRKAAAAYCEALYHELDLADVFLAAGTPRVDCQTVVTNDDCIHKATTRAKIIVQKRTKRLYGFGWFGKAA
jgi:hypothetical protein